MPKQKDFVYSDVASSLRTLSDGNKEVVYDADAVIQSIKNIFSTIRGERVRSGIGSGLLRYLFEPMESDTADEIRTEIITNIRRYEPRVGQLDVTVRGDYTSQTYDVTVNFTIDRFTRPFRFDTRLRAMGEN